MKPVSIQSIDVNNIRNKEEGFVSFNFLTDANPLEKVFYCCAIVGTLFFIIRFVMMFIGAGGEDGMDGDFDGGDIDGDGALDADSDAAFGILSINTITAFFMMFGWSGLTAYVQFQLGVVASLVIAFLVGFLCMLFTAYLFKSARKLVSKGATFNIESTVGKKASVYQKVPVNGKGRINYSMPGSNTRELDAIAADKRAIDSFKTVVIVEVIDNNTVSVREV